MELVPSKNPFRIQCGICFLAITACATTGFGAATLTGWGITVLPQRCFFPIIKKIFIIVELCLQGAGTSTISIGTKAAAVLVPEVLVFYNNVRLHEN